MNTVDRPILNNPFREPIQHWDFSGPSPRIAEGRRPARYFGTLRTDATAGATVSQEQLPLELVNEIRHRVNQWRQNRWPGVTRVTRDLLEHWHREDRRPLFFAQREAVETIIWLTEAAEADRQGIEVPLDAPNDVESLTKGYAALRRYCSKMATGSGKTTVMAMVAAWNILNKVVDRQNAKFTDAVLVVGPNLTVKERLAVLDPKLKGNVYEEFDLVPSGYRDLLARGRVFITNWHAFAVKDDSNKRGIVQRGRESDAAFVKRVLGRELGTSGAVLVLNDEAHHAYRPASPAQREEAKRELEGFDRESRKEVEEYAEEATVWVSGLDRINKVRGIRLVVDVSATPFYIKGTGYPEGQPLPWIVSDFGLVDAIECGITKIPRVPVADDAGGPDPKYFRLWQHIMDALPAGEREKARRRAKPESVWREAQGAMGVLAGKWLDKKREFEASQMPVPPALIVVCANTALATVVEEAIQNGEVLDQLRGPNTFRIDSSKLDQAEAAEGTTKADEQQKLRMKVATVGKAEWPGGRPPEGFEAFPEPPGKNVQCVVSVGMLTEGWDARNVTQILGLRAFGSQLLCEQVVGRGLRRMSYTLNEEGLLDEEYCDVFGIPFEAIPVQGSNPGVVRPPPPSTLVMALPERQAALEIEFPRVEGYVVDVRDRIRCDVSKVEPIHLTPQVEPTQTVVRSQGGWVVGHSGLGQGAGETETLTRERFYEEHRLQRTAFEIARDIVEVFAGGRSHGETEVEPKVRSDAARLLFPQVLRVVEAYLATRVVLASPEARIEEVALARYRDIVVNRLIDAIEPESTSSTPPLLPRIERHRPTGSTKEVLFRTMKPVQQTLKSHVSHVVLDSITYEGSAAFHLEQSPHVVAYVKNDRLDFEIIYDWMDGQHSYRPDFIARVRTPDGEVKLILETKGYEREQDRSKHEAAKKWVRAVNHDGRYGQWAFLVCTEPNRLASVLASFAARAAA